MFLPDTAGDFAEFTSLSLTPKKLKPHLPADSIGKRYVEYFWHPYLAIIAPLRLGDTKPGWRTISYFLQPSQLWNLHQDSTQLVGLRFGNTTSYAIIDLDAGGDYHNPQSIKRIKHALEDIGIVATVILQSSFSGGYHLLLLFEKALPTFALACALELALKKVGLNVRSGHLEIFPNTKPYGVIQITNYNAIRCPMQPGSGSFLLDDELQPISNSVSVFLDYCDNAARRQDLTLLKRACERAKKRITKERRRKKDSTNFLEWRKDWETVIATGWTGFGQTNTLLQIFVGYGLVFQRIEDYSKLIEYVVETARNAPGYTEYCRHQHEIETRVRDWVECTIRNQWYSRYLSYPQRPLGTFDKTFADAIAPRKNQSKPKDNTIPFDRRVAQSQKRSQEAQRRISLAVNALEWGTGLATGITARAKQICAECKRQFNLSLSLQTLHKYLHLWHPQWYIEDPWAENSSNTSQINGYRCFDELDSFEKNQNAQNPYPMDRYSYDSYMKVLCLPPAPTAPSGLEAAEVQEQTEESQEDSEVTQPEENLKLINSSNGAENNSNKPSNQDKSVQTNILQLNSLSSDQDFIYLCSPGASPKTDNQNLSIAEDNGLGISFDTC